MKASNKRTCALALSALGTATLTGYGDLAHAATTYLGNAINYGYGIVQVQITVDGANRITQIDTPQVSTRGSNSYYTNLALPVLVKEALAAQSAAIQGVSGASYLSQGWITSLASAIAKEGGAVTPASPSPTPTATPTPLATPKPSATRIVPPQNNSEGEEHQGVGEHQDGEHHEGGREHPGEGRAPITPAPAPIIKSPTPVASPTLSSPPSGSLGSLGLKPGAGVIQKSITCVKGATKKVVKGLNPKCPTGFTLKKP